MNRESGDHWAGSSWRESSTFGETIVSAPVVTSRRVRSPYAGELERRYRRYLPSGEVRMGESLPDWIWLPAAKESNIARGVMLRKPCSERKTPKRF